MSDAATLHGIIWCRDRGASPWQLVVQRLPNAELRMDQEEATFPLHRVVSSCAVRRYCALNLGHLTAHTHARHAVHLVAVAVSKRHGWAKFFLLAGRRRHLLPLSCHNLSRRSVIRVSLRQVCNCMHMHTNHKGPWAQKC